MGGENSGIGRAGNILHRRGGREIFKRLSGEAVQRIADQGMTDGCQMDSDLMRAARIQADLKCCSACCAA